MASERVSDGALRFYAGLVTQYRPTEADEEIEANVGGDRAMARELLALRAERERFARVVEAARELVRSAPASRIDGRAFVECRVCGEVAWETVDTAACSAAIVHDEDCEMATLVAALDALDGGDR